MENEFVRLNESNISEIGKKIEQTYLDLQENIKSICEDKKLMNLMLTQVDYIIYASKLYGGKHCYKRTESLLYNKLTNWR